MSDLVSINQIHKMAVALGGTTHYNTFKKFIKDEHSDILLAAVCVDQGNRVVRYVARDVASRVASKFANAYPKVFTRIEAQQKISTPAFRPITSEHVRAAGGIFHSDGNIFFTNLEQLNNAIEAANGIGGGV